MSKIQESWGSRVGLILAMAGNAVGLGNFLRFPFQAIQNGGGAFIIPYLVCFLILGIPLLFVEWASGRFGGQFGHHTTPFAFAKMHKGKLWKYIGAFGIFSNLAIAAYYCYVESWAMSWVYHSVIGTFKNLSIGQVSEFFNNYTDIFTSTTGIPYEAIVFYVICLALNVYILSKGLKGGVEKVAKILMPLLLIFGVFLAIKGITLKAGKEGALFDGLVGLNFLWTPDYASLLNPKVWLAAAGQVFFTLSLGLGTIHCFASYVKKDDDIALNALSAGWINEFVEVILGGSIIIPIAIGYFGLDKVFELSQLGGMGLGFRVMPYLFQQWGPVLSIIAGISFFGLLFFAGITSSLAMGTPLSSFLVDEFEWSRRKSALAYGVSVLIIGMPTVLFFNNGVFDEYDFWAGTVSLVLFALLEIILFAWVFGADRGWKEFQKGADVRVPSIFKYLIKYVTPVILIIVFVSAFIRPANDDWQSLSFKGWELHNESILGKIMNLDVKQNAKYFDTKFYSETSGVVDSVFVKNNSTVIDIFNVSDSSHSLVKVQKNCTTNLQSGDYIKTGDVLFTGKVINNIFYKNMSRILLTITFLGIVILIYIADRKNNPKRLRK